MKKELLLIGKIFTSLILCLVFSSNGFSQFSIKPYLGYSFSKISNQNELDFKLENILIYDGKFYGPKLVYGLEFSHSLSEKFDLSLDISRTEGGSLTNKYSGSLSYSLLEVKLHTTQVRTSIKYKLRKWFIINIGISSEVLEEIEWETYKAWAVGYYQTVEMDEYYSRFAFGLNSGFTFQWKNLELGVLYTHGLTKIYETDKLSWLQFTLGYRFDLTKGKE